MLEKVPTMSSGHYMDFGSVSRYDIGVGRCFVYNSVMKSTKAGKPFITLYLRDVQGNSVPGYVFDLKSPLMAGGEVAKVVNKIVEIEWQENYLTNLGLTLILDKVSVVESAGPDDYGKFRGTINNLEKKVQGLRHFVFDALNMNVSLPVTIETTSAVDYCQGRVGGLAEHYWRMSKMLGGLQGLSEIEYRKLIATFLLYILVHSNYIRARDQGQDNISLVTSLTEKVSAISTQLEAGEGSLELVHMFFGYTPKDIYVRTVAAVSEAVQRVDHEFSLYHTIPLAQEGNAGYGTIRRYQVEKMA